MSYLCLQNPSYTVQKHAGIIGTGISITDIIQKLVWTNISLASRNIFSFHYILHVFGFYQFTASLKQFKTPFYNLADIFVAPQNLVTCQFNFEYIHLKVYSSKVAKSKLHLFEYQLMQGSFATLAKCSSVKKPCGLQMHLLLYQ